MGVVFVHGVSNRFNADYRESEAVRTELMRSWLFPVLGIADDAKPINPYWGEFGANFRWNHASLPAGDYQTFGGGDPLSQLLLPDPAPGQAQVDPSAPLLQLARTSISDALDAAWTLAAMSTDEPEVARELAALSRVFEDFIGGVRPSWWDEVHDDEELMDRLFTELRARIQDGSGGQSFGSGALGRGFARFREAVSRLGSAASRATGAAVVSLGRTRAHMAASMFMGDVFTYLGTRNKPGSQDSKIIATVTEAFREASSSGPLIILAHSMGGNIAYDILSSYATDLQCEALVTVGSQVGVFEELKLLEGSNPTFPTNPARDRVAVPANIKRWINVFDPLDVLGFAVSRVFDRASDFEYSTGVGAFKAHGTYFTRPSFYRRLAARLKVVP